MKEGIQPELAAFLASAVKVCGADSRICAVLVGGSVAARSTDRFSDLDLIIVCRDADYAEVMAGRREFAGKLGKLLAAFTGEHVGEPRLLICLFGEPLLHVDLKFVTADTLAQRVEPPLVALDKNGAASSAIKTGSAEWPSRSAEWFEDRFWIWMHYGACKIARGELFEAVDLLSFVRGAVLGPMIARNGGRRQRGVRQVEFESPQSVEALARTIPRYDREDCWRALKAAIALYEELRRDQQPANRSEAAERAVKAYIEGLIC
jgi:predicted nucleotidyltransferase